MHSETTSCTTFYYSFVIKVEQYRRLENFHCKIFLLTHYQQQKLNKRNILFDQKLDIFYSIEVSHRRKLNRQNILLAKISQSMVCLVCHRHIVYNVHAHTDGNNLLYTCLHNNGKALE